MNQERLDELMNSSKGLELKLSENRISRIRAREVARDLNINTYGVLNEESIISVFESHDFDSSSRLTQDLADQLWTSKVEDFYATKPRFLRAINGSIGDIYLPYSRYPLMTTFFTNKFNWTPGDFGDSGSCFWQSRAGAKDMIQEHGFALKFYNGGTRFGRCWGTIVKEGLLIFNAYSNSGIGNALSFYADILFRQLGDYKNYYRVSLTNNGSNSNVLYINKGEGILLTNLGLNDNYKINLKWKEIRLLNCNWCRRPFPESSILTIEDRACCNNCVESVAFTCFNCFEMKLKQNQHKYSKDKKEQHYCGNCFGKMFAVCRFDGQIYPKSEMKMIDFGDWCSIKNLERFSIKHCESCGAFNHKRRDWCYECGKILKPIVVQEKIEEEKIDMTKYFTGESNG